METESETAQAIRTLRKQTGLSLDDFGERIGVSRIGIHRYEKGELKPSNRIAWRLVRIALELNRKDLATQLVQPISDGSGLSADYLLDGMGRTAA